MGVEQESADAAYAYLRESAPVLTIHLDRQMRVIDLNDLSRQALPESIIGRPIAEAMANGADMVEFERLVSEHGGERLLTLKSTSELPETYRFRFFPLASGWLALGSLDFFEQQRLRREVLELNHDLGTLTRELRQANRELRDLNELNNQFLGMAAHDLRKPVGVVMTYCEFVLDEAGEQMTREHREFLNICLRSAKHMKALIDNFLDVSIIESGNLRLNLVHTSVGAILISAREICDLPARRKKIIFTMDCDKHLPAIIADPSKIQQVLINLVGNAIEHSDAGKRVWIAAVRDGDSVVFSVRDEGPGITADDQKRLFSPFAQAGTRKTGGERSTGLGLSIARKIVQAHRGRIWLDSIPGEGTTFFFSLPLGLDGAEEKSEMPRPGHGHSHVQI